MTLSPTPHPLTTLDPGEGGEHRPLSKTIAMAYTCTYLVLMTVLCINSILADPWEVATTISPLYR